MNFVYSHEPHVAESRTLIKRTFNLADKLSTVLPRRGRIVQVSMGQHGNVTLWLECNCDYSGEINEWVNVTFHRVLEGDVVPTNTGWRHLSSIPLPHNNFTHLYCGEVHAVE